MIGPEVGPRPKQTNQSPPLDSNTDVGQEGCCKDLLGLGHKCLSFLAYDISLTENEAQEMEGSIAESLKETEMKKSPVKRATQQVYLTTSPRNLRKEVPLSSTYFTNEAAHS